MTVPSRVRVFVSTAAVLAAVLLLRWLLDPILLGTVPHVLLFAVVAFAVWMGGYRLALLVAALGYLVARYLFIEPRGSFDLSEPRNIIGFIAYLLTCAIIIGFGEAMRTAQQRACESLESLAAGAERFRLAAEAVNGLIYEFDLRTGHVLRSGALLEIVGYLPQEVPPTAEWWWEQVHPEDRGFIQRQGQPGMARSVRHEYRVRHRDGRWIYVEDRALVMRGHDGRPVKMVGFTVDVSDRKQAEQQVRASEERLRLFIEHAPVAIAMFDRSMRYLAASRRWLTDYGLENQQIINRSHYDLFPDIPDRWREVHRRALNGEVMKATEDRFDRADGQVQWVWWEVRPWYEIDGGLGGIIIFAEDISARKRVEMALRESRRQEQERAATLETVLRATPAPIWIAHDRECRDVIGNPASYRLLGIPEGTNLSATAAEVSYRPYRECHDGTPIPPAELPMQRAAATGVEVQGAEVCMVFDDGHACHLYGNAAPIRGADGAVNGCVAAFMDVTELKKVEQALKEGDQRKDEFLATLAHELRNPLAPLRSAVQILQLKIPPIPDLEWATDIIDRQTRHMTRLVDDLLDVSRISRGTLVLSKEQVELARCVNEAIETSRPLIEADHHQLNVRLPPEPIYLDADVTRLVQVFSNVLNNAVKYSHKCGQISLTAERRGNAAVVKVRDNGVGISPELLPHVFDLFAQVDRSIERTQDGLGIGLSLVKRLVEMHGGAVEIRSDGIGKGAEVEIRLPIAANRLTHPPRAPEKTTEIPLHASFRILVVDDNRAAADSLAWMLRSMGNDTRVVYNGIDAIDVAADFCPQVVLLDIGMPKMNGYDVARRIRERPWGKTITLIAVTGWGQEEHRRRSIEAGFDAHMVKPLEADALLKLLAATRPRQLLTSDAKPQRKREIEGSLAKYESHKGEVHE